MRKSIEVIIANMVNEVCASVDEKRIEDIALSEIRAQLRSGYEWSPELLGNKLKEIVLTKVADKFVSENYDKITKGISIEDIAKLSTIRIASGYSQRV